MGRATYDWIERFPGAWEYAGKRVIVVTSRPIDNPKGPLETRSDIPALIAELRGLDDGDVWMLGGGKLQMTFMEQAALDEIEIYIISEIIGGSPKPLRIVKTDISIFISSPPFVRQIVSPA